MAGETPPLAATALRALRWNYAGNLIRAMLQLGIGVLLARLLGPEPFGTVAIAMIVIGLGMLFADLGFGAALVQRPAVVERDVGYVFTVQLALGAALSLAVVVLAGRGAAFFGKPEAAPVLRVTALLFVLQAPGLTALAVLRHSLNFRAAQVNALLSYLVGYLGVGVPAALAGWGAWSLVAAQLTQSAASSTMAVLSCPVRLRPTLTPESPGLLLFGTKVLGANLSSWGIGNLDSVVVGRVLTATELGVYGRAFALVSTPVASVAIALQGVLLAACSRAQHDLARIRKAYVGSTMVMAALCLPVFVTVSAIPGTVVLGVLGPKWTAAIPVLTPLALAMALHGLTSVVGPVLTALDRVTTEVRVQVAVLLLMGPVVFLAAQRSLAAVGWAVFALYATRWVLLSSGALTVVGARWPAILGPLRWPLLSSIFVAGGTWAADRALSSFVAPARLAADIAVAVAILALAARPIGARMLRSPEAASLRSSGGVPAAVRWWCGV